MPPYSQNSVFRAISIGYHDVMQGETRFPAHSPPGLWRYTLSRRNFRHHLTSILSMAPAGSVLTLDQVRTFNSRPPVFLTFDDGAVGTYDYIADDLEQFGWRGHFFVVSDWIGRPGFLNRQQIRELRSRGHLIGSHSATHPARMSSLTRTVLMREWSESCTVLANILGESVTIASVANGYYSPSVCETAAASGIQVLFNSEPTMAVSVVRGCLLLGRYSIIAETPPAVSGALAAGRPFERWRQKTCWEMKKLAKKVTGEAYLTLRESLLRHQR